MGARVVTDTTSVLDYTCDGDGMWLHGIATEYEGEASGYSYSGWSEVVYDTPMLVTPQSLSVGDTWTAAGSGTITTDQYFIISKYGNTQRTDQVKNFM